MAVVGGRTRAVARERLEVQDAERALLLLRFEYLDVAAAANRAALRGTLADLPGDYAGLLAPRAAAHEEMFRRVTLNLGGPCNEPPAAEELLGDAGRGESLPEFFELMHAVGRYALVCCGTGELPPSLMGHWGNSWDPPWNGCYTFDANTNLAMAASATGNLPEMTASFVGFLGRFVVDWWENDRRIFGCRVVLTDLCGMAWPSWTPIPGRAG